MNPDLLKMIDDYSGTLRLYKNDECIEITRYHKLWIVNHVDKDGRINRLGSDERMDTVCNRIKLFWK